MPWVGAALLLLAPAVAMQFTPEVDWGPGDFAIFAGMLIVACAAFEFSLRAVRDRYLRVVAGFMIAGAFLLVWAQLAVGIW